MELQNLKISELIRYGFSGLNALIIIILFPFLTLNPKSTIAYFNFENITFFIIICFALGLLIDSIKLYQMRFGYERRKRKFLGKFSEILGIDESKSTVYFSSTLHFLESKGEFSLERKHSEWILADNNSVFFLVSSLLWIGICIYKIYIGLFIKDIIIPIICLVIAILFMILFFKVAKQERIKLDNFFYEFAEKNRDKILKSIML